MNLVKPPRKIKISSVDDVDATDRCVGQRANAVHQSLPEVFAPDLSHFRRILRIEGIGAVLISGQLHENEHGS